MSYRNNVPSEAIHDDICGALVHNLLRLGWEVRLEEPLEPPNSPGWKLYADVIARPKAGQGRWVLFEVKSIKEDTTFGATITQIRKYRDALSPLASVLVTAFDPTWGQMQLLKHAGIDWVKVTPRYYGHGEKPEAWALEDFCDGAPTE